MGYLVFIKTSHVAGPQPQTVTETQKAQTVYAATSINYTLNANAQTAPSEPNSAQSTYAVTALNYA